MKKILLTSTGFNNKNIENKFIELLNKKVEDSKILFIITAANDPGAVRILSSCLDDLTNCGICDENIIVCDMHKKMGYNDIKNYDAIYVCGGSTKYLVDRIDELNFKDTIDEYIKNGGIYIGVSAGSVAASGKYIKGLNLIDNILDVHCEVGSQNGTINYPDEIKLTDNQAIYINDKEKIIFE